MVLKKDIIEDNNPNCLWRNIIFQNKFSTSQLAKDWLNNNIDLILSKYNLHKLNGE
jgi:hypothetical protein